MASIRQRIERGGERLWRPDDFREFSFMAVAQALSRLKREGTLERVSKGVYYRSRDTAFGKSRPSPAAIKNLGTEQRSVYPSGFAAANLLGFTTQAAKRGEIATSRGSLPRKLIGSDTVIHTRRPGAWEQLSQEEGALLDFLRRRGQISELSPEETVRRTIKLMSEPGRYERLLKIADTEPPRVRAMLGAIGEQMGKRNTQLEQLRDSLNPYSRFDFGLLSALAAAASWQAKVPA
jgi:hypothetical protein